MEVIEGQVRKLSPVSKNRVQFEFANMSKVFELFIDQSWVMDIGDAVIIAGKPDSTGKFCGYAYSNKTKGVKGWKYTDYLSMLFLLGSSIVGFLFYFVLASVFMRSNTSALIFTGIGFTGVFLFLRNPVREFILLRKCKSAVCS